MADSRTSTTLLEALHDPTDSAAWQRFDVTYRPILFRFALKLGLDQDDANEAAQRTTVAFCQAHRRGMYDRSKGRFKNWLLTVARNEIAKLQAQRAKQAALASDQDVLVAALPSAQGPQSPSSIWDAKWEEHVLVLCLQEARRKFLARDMRVFELLTIEQRSTAAVAEEMGMTTNAVYKTKYRVLRYMTQVRKALEGEG